MFGVLMGCLMLSGLDAIERVMHKARGEGRRHFGHGYKKSIDSPTALASFV